MLQKLLFIILTSTLFFSTHAESLAETRELAEKGDAEAQFKLGISHIMIPIHQSTNTKHAVYWFTKAAEQGHGTAQEMLGGIYADEESEPVDHKQSEYWYNQAVKSFEKAAQSGDNENRIKFLLRLGNMFTYGQGVEPSVPKAIAYFQQAADLGSTKAEEALSYLSD